MVVRLAPARTVTVAPVIFVVLAAQVADAISFAVGVAQLGIAVEGNPLMRAAHGVAGTTGVLGIKAVAIGIVIAMLIAAGPRFPKFATVGSYATIGLGVFGAAMNTAVMVLVAAGG